MVSCVMSSGVGNEDWMPSAMATATYSVPGMGNPERAQDEERRTCMYPTSPAGQVEKYR